MEKYLRALAEEGQYLRAFEWADRMEVDFLFSVHIPWLPHCFFVLKIGREFCFDFQSLHFSSAFFVSKCTPPSSSASLTSQRVDSSQSQEKRALATKIFEEVCLFDSLTLFVEINHTLVIYFFNFWLQAFDKFYVQKKKARADRLRAMREERKRRKEEGMRVSFFSDFSFFYPVIFFIFCSLFTYPLHFS